MSGSSTRLSITSVGRAVAQSVLHPRSGHQLMEYAADRVSDLVSLSQKEEFEEILNFSLLYAAYSSDEYNEIRGNSRSLPYQLDNLVSNALADRSEKYLIERPWRRNVKSANAAMVAIRWANGQERNALAQEFQRIGSGILQTMFREGAEIIFAWSDCLRAGTAPNLLDEDRPRVLQQSADVLRALRNLVWTMRAHAGPLFEGLPGDVAWMGALTVEAIGQRLLSRRAIMSLYKSNLITSDQLLRRDKYPEIVAALRVVDIQDADYTTKELRSAVEKYRQNSRRNLWRSAIDRVPGKLKKLFEEAIVARQKSFENKIEDILDEAGIAYERLDDGTIPGAPDLRLGLNHTIQVVVELKTGEGKNAVRLNSATDVIKGAAIVGLPDLPKVTIANPGFEPNVAWQARNVKDLGLVEASQFAYGISLLTCGEITKEMFLDWLVHPGTLSVSQLRYATSAIRDS